MADVKVTKKDWYAQIAEVVEASETENKADILAFIEHEVELLNSKAEKAARRAELKKSGGDVLRTQVQQILTDNLQTIEELTAQIDDVGVTKAKVTARLTQLVKAGVATKDMVKNADGRKVTAYKLADIDAAE